MDNTEHLPLDLEALAERTRAENLWTDVGQCWNNDEIYFTLRHIPGEG